MIGRKSEDEKAGRDAARRQAESQQAAEREQAAFYASPVGRARYAFEAGRFLFQYAHNVTKQQAVVVAMVGASNTVRTSDPNDVLNAICAEGWDLVNASFAGPGPAGEAGRFWQRGDAGGCGARSAVCAVGDLQPGRHGAKTWRVALLIRLNLDRRAVHGRSCLPRSFPYVTGEIASG